MQYTYDTLIHSNGKIEYKITESGTAYHIDTPDTLVEIIEQLRAKNARITLDYGDVKAGKSWEEDCDIAGRIGRSTGKFKIPLLIYSMRSLGGSAILDNCILSIKHANKKDGGIIYQLEGTK